jgi:hypothetical protein
MMQVLCIDEGNGKIENFQTPSFGEIYNVTKVVISHKICPKCKSKKWYVIDNGSNLMHSECLFVDVPDTYLSDKLKKDRQQKLNKLSNIENLIYSN